MNSTEENLLTADAQWSTKKLRPRAQKDNKVCHIELELQCPKKSCKTARKKSLVLNAFCRTTFSMNVGSKFEIRNEKFHSYLLGQITLIPESVAVSDSQEIFHNDSAKKRRINVISMIHL